MWFQTPQYLRWSRMHLLKPENRQRILNFIGIRPGDRVLDVGCGSGELTRYLAQGVDATFVGIDLDEGLIAAARETACDNTSYMCADALSLPFEENSFDLVISHTFFTAVFDAETAMEQMRTVCKPGGIIASITPDSITALPHSPGVYPNAPWVDAFQKLRRKLDLAFHAEASRCCVGVLPEDMPRFFAAQGLTNVQVHPIEKFCCLSNLTPEDQQHYLQLEYESELSRLDLLPQQDREQYVKLLKERKNHLTQPENEIWDWSGGTNLLITAANTKEALASQRRQNAAEQTDMQAVCMRAHVGSFATVMVKDENGKALYSAAPSPSAAMTAARNQLIARRYARLGGKVCSAEQLLHGNLPLKTSLKQLNEQLEDSDAAYLQELLQWECSPVADEFTQLSTGNSVLLPRWLTQWCFGEDTCCAGATPEEAKLESLYHTCAQFALKQIVVQQLTPPKLSSSVWEAVPEVSEAVSILRTYGIRVTFFDASCSMDLPVIGAYAVGNGGAKLRTHAGRSQAEAILACTADLMEGCTPDRFFVSAANITSQKPTHAQLFNVLTTGEGYFPASLLGADAQWIPRSWDSPTCDSAAACEALLKQLAAMGWDVYGRLISADGNFVYQTVIPEAGMSYNFGSQRLLEHRLRALAAPILRNFVNATAEQQALAIKYVSMKRDWIRECTFSYLAETENTPQLFGVDVDARILLGLYHIHTGEKQVACNFLPNSNNAYRCLKRLLCGESPEVLAILYSDEAVEAAQAVQQTPLGILPVAER